MLLIVGLDMIGNNIPEYLLIASSDDQLATYALADWLEENNDNSLFVRREEFFPLAIEQCMLARYDGGYGSCGYSNYGGYGGHGGYGGSSAGYGSNGGYGGYGWNYSDNDWTSYCGSGYD